MPPSLLGGQLFKVYDRVGIDNLSRGKDNISQRVYIVIWAAISIRQVARSSLEVIN